MDKEITVTLAKEGHSEFTEKKSVFIGSARPVKDENEALEFIRLIKKKYSDARHNVYAYSLSQGNTARYSDDGEPQGTGGLPVLEIIKKTGVSNAAVVVTRYFGGILLGTGGLSRAYSQAAAEAVRDAGIVRCVPHTFFEVSMTYQDYSRVLKYLADFKIEDSLFGENVVLSVAVKNGEKDRFVSLMTEETSGRALLSEKGVKSLPE